MDSQICRVLALVWRSLVCTTHCICIGDGLADQPRINIGLADSSRIDTLVLDSNRIGAEWHLIGNGLSDLSSVETLRMVPCSTCSNK